MVGRRWQAIDAMTAVVLATACAFAVQEAGRSPWWQWVAAGAVALPVAVRGRWPLVAAMATLAASATVLIGQIVPSNAAMILCVAVALPLYTVAAGQRLSRSGPVLAAGLVAAAMLTSRWPAAPLAAAPAVAVPWLVGWMSRQRRHRARRIAEEQTAQAVLQERLRIARDMHDAVAHSLSMITMKASVARHVAASRPEESATALAVIESAGRAALVEMRRAVGLLRADEDPAVPTGSDEDLRALAEGAQQAGIRVELTIEGAATLPAGVRLTLYRVVQEALTNVLRHAKATRCAITVAAGADAVTVEVLDDGTAGVAAFEARGYGLRGMRERVIAYGGSLQAGPRAAGGFAVSARLPCRRSGAEAPP